MGGSGEVPPDGVVALLGAMKGEIATLRQKMEGEEVFVGPGCMVYAGRFNKKGVLLVKTGMGRSNAERAARFVLGRFPVRAMVSIGFAGALDKGLEAGDIVVYSSMYGMDGGDLAPEVCSGPALLQKAGKVLACGSFKVVQAIGVTVPAMVTDPEQKKALTRVSPAQSVDMESYWIARAARDKGVPFVAVRAVSDTLEERLPPFERFVSHRGWNIRKAGAYFLFHPGQVLKLLRLRANVKRAEANLSSFVECFVAEI